MGCLLKDTNYKPKFDLRNVGPSVVRDLVKFFWVVFLGVSDSVDTGRGSGYVTPMVTVHGTCRFLKRLIFSLF